MATKKPEENKTLFYIIETINVLVENEKILLNRIKKLEENVDMLAEQFYDDTDEDRIIN